MKQRTIDIDTFSAAIDMHCFNRWFCLFYVLKGVQCGAVIFDTIFILLCCFVFVCGILSHSMPRIRCFNRKQRHHGNRYTVKGVTTNVTPVAQDCNLSEPVNNTPPSASRRKLVFGANENAGCESEGSCNIIVDVNILSQLILDNVMCQHCFGVQCVSVVEDKSARKGLATNLSVICSKCNVGASCMTSKIANKGYDVNLRLAYGMRCIGRGQKAARTLCAVMNLPPPSAKFERYYGLLLGAVKEVAESSMKSAAEESIVENDGDRDIVAAFDGTWQKRGHTSLNGVVTATSVDTGKVLDVEVLSKFCHSCVKGIADHVCNMNYKGSSGGMEVQGVVSLFTRSVASRGLRYVKYLGDGDSKAFLEVQKCAPYDETIVQKLECVGHVQKRLGTRLRRLRQDLSGKKLSDGKGIKGRGRLTDAEIDKLQTYYGLAIRRNTGDLKNMKQAVWALYFHKMSTDNNPIHNLCPKGSESWCGYQRSIAGGEEYHHRNSLPTAVMEAIKPIFRDLANENLLKKCLHGGTQNPNESFNQCIWERLPKTVFVGRNALAIGVYDAVSCFNDGVQSRKYVLEKMGIKPGVNCIKSLYVIDRERVVKADKSFLEVIKSRRVHNRNVKRKETDIEDEKVPAYGAGQY